MAELEGWAIAEGGVLAGPRPDGALSLADLATAAGQGHLVPRLRVLMPDADERQVLLTAVHYALHTVANVVLAPMVVDRVPIRVAGDQVGFVVGDDGGLVAFWIGEHQRIDADDPLAAARGALGLVLPVADAFQKVGAIPRRGLRNIVLDSLHGSCEWFDRLAVPAEPLAGAFFAAAGVTDHRVGRQIHVRPDDGEPVALRVPRTCCVMKTDAGCHSCPTCPQLEDDAARERVSLDWLHGLDDAGFRTVTGRDRVDRGTPRPPRTPTSPDNDQRRPVGDRP